MSQIDPIQGRRVVGLTVGNSTGFVELAFSVLRSGDILALIRDENDSERRKISRVSRVLNSNRQSGWYTGQVLPAPSNAEHIAQVSFTSGTEGEAKGVAIAHRALENTTSRLIDAMRLDGTIREYIGAPVYLSFGFGRCRAVSRCGGNFYVPPAGFDMLEIERMLKQGEINAVSAVPSLWRLVLANSHRFSPIGARLRWIETGSQPMQASEKKQLRALFPNAIIVQHYGLTEASRSTFLPIHDAPLESLDSVGRPSHGCEVRTGDDNRIELRGPHLADYVYQNDRWEWLSDGDGWFTSSDSGYIDEQGWLFFAGRADDLINCGGVKLSPDLIEQRIRDELAVTSDIGVARIPDDVRGDGILIATTPDAGVGPAKLREVSNRIIAAMGVNAGLAVRCIELTSLPKTASGKLERKRLAELSNGERHVRSSTPSLGDGAPRDRIETFLARIYDDVLNIAGSGQDTELFRNGADSLAAVTLVSGIFAEYGVELTLTDLLESSRLADVASKIRWYKAGRPERACRYLIPFVQSQPATNAAPIVMIGGAYGNVLHLHALAGSLGHLGDVYGLQYPGIIPGDSPVDSIPRVGAAFRGELTQVLDNTSFHLIGYSGGGIIALELARQLIEKGKEIRSFSMIDTRLPERLPYTQPFGPVERQVIRLIAIVRKRKRLLRQGIGFVRKSLRRGDATAAVDEDRPDPARRRSIAIRDAYRKGLEVYSIPRLALSLHYYRPADERRYRIGRKEIDFVENEPHRIDETCNGWHEFFDNATSTVVPGDHYSLIAPPCASALADALAEVMTGRS